MVDINANKYKALVLCVQIFESRNDDDNDFYLYKYLHGFKPELFIIEMKLRTVKCKSQISHLAVKKSLINLTQFHG